MGVDVFDHDRQSPAEPRSGFVSGCGCLGKQGLLAPRGSGTSAGAGRTSLALIERRRGASLFTSPWFLLQLLQTHACPGVRQNDCKNAAS